MRKVVIGGNNKSIVLPVTNKKLALPSVFLIFAHFTKHFKPKIFVSFIQSDFQAQLV